MPDRGVLFGCGLGAWNGVDVGRVADSARLAAEAERDGLDLFTVADYPYFGDKLDAYAVLSFVLGQTERINPPGPGRREVAALFANGQPHEQMPRVGRVLSAPARPAERIQRLDKDPQRAVAEELGEALDVPRAGFSYYVEAEASWSFAGGVE